MMRAASRWCTAVSTAVRSNSWAASMSSSHLPWFTMADSARCAGGEGMLSLGPGMKRRAGSSRRSAGGSEWGRKRDSFSPWMVWYSKAS